MKLGLIRRQKICRIGEEDATIPIDLSCETIAETSLSNLGWWYPLASKRKDQVTLAVEAPVSRKNNMDYYVHCLLICLSSQKNK